MSLTHPPSDKAMRPGKEFSVPIHTKRRKKGATVKTAQVLMIATLLASGCVLFQTRDLQQDYAAALRVYTGTTTLAADAIKSGLIKPAQVPAVKTASDSAYSALKLLSAAVNAKDKASFDAYFKVFQASIDTLNVILKGVNDGSVLGPSAFDWEQPRGDEASGDWRTASLGASRPRGELDARADCIARSGCYRGEGEAGRGGSGGTSSRTVRDGTPSVLDYCINLFCGEAQGAEAAADAPGSGPGSGVLTAVLLLLNSITGVVIVILNGKKKIAQSNAAELTTIITAVAGAVKFYAETKEQLPNAEVTAVIQEHATAAGVEPKLNAILVGANLLAN